MNAGRMGFRMFLVVGLLATVVLAFFVTRFASGEPDGLERVAIDHGFAEQAQPHALEDLPTADYAVRGLGDGGTSTGLAGVIGVAATFALAGGALLVARRLGSPRRHSSARRAPA